MKKSIFRHLSPLPCLRKEKLQLAKLAFVINKNHISKWKKNILVGEPKGKREVSNPPCFETANRPSHGSNRSQLTSFSGIFPSRSRRVSKSGPLSHWSWSLRGGKGWGGGEGVGGDGGHGVGRGWGRGGVGRGGGYWGGWASASQDLQNPTCATPNTNFF